MPLLGKNLTGPKLAAAALSVYAAVYLVFLMYAVGADIIRLWQDVWMVLFYLFMAAAPFTAMSHLYRITHPVKNRPVRPKVLAVYMALPTLFWLYVIVNGLRTIMRQPFDSMLIALGISGVPAILSIWLLVAFILLARRRA